MITKKAIINGWVVGGAVITSGIINGAVAV